MERLSGPDATMLYTETPTSHMHTMKVAVLDPSHVDGAYDRDRLISELRERLPLLDAFRRRAVRVPFGLHHPMWVEDPEFDLDHHVHAMEVEPPGDQRALDAVLSAIHARPLPRDRPLWEMTLISGLDGGRVAVAAKIHHALADGMAAVTALAHVGAADETSSRSVDVEDGWAPEPIPGAGTLLAGAVTDRLRSLRHVPDLVARSVRGMRRAKRRRREIDEQPPGPLRCPTTSFNGSLTRQRAVATVKLALDDVRAIKSATGTTVNDVLLAATAGALRRVLDERGERHDRPLICAIPVSIDTSDAPPRRTGNRVGQLFTSLRTDLDDPLERLAAIGAVTKNAKLLNAELGPELTHDWNEYASAGPYQLLWRTVMPRVGRAPVNIVVSNVPGPREPLWFAGAEMVDFYSLSVLNEGIGANLTVWSYLDHLAAGFTTCPALMPDPHEFTESLVRAVDELHSLTLTAS